MRVATGVLHLYRGDLNHGMQRRQRLAGEHDALRRRQARRIGSLGQGIYPHRIGKRDELAVLVLRAWYEREGQRNVG